MLLFVILASVVLLLTILGVAGLTAQIVSRRTREAGIRLALGARPREIVQLMIGHLALPIAVGIAAGWIAAWWTARFLESFLFQVPARGSADVHVRERGARRGGAGCGLAACPARRASGPCRYAAPGVRIVRVMDA